MVTWTTTLGDPLLIQMLEDEQGAGTITLETTGKVLSFEVLDKPEWLHTTHVGSSLDCTVALTDSPFKYQVDSVDAEYQQHSTHSFLEVPCNQRTFAYTRQDSGILVCPLTVRATISEVDDATGLSSVNQYEHTVNIEIRANYSIGKTALQGVIQCQP